MKKFLLTFLILSMSVFVSLSVLAVGDIGDNEGNDIVTINVPYNILLDVANTNQSLTLEFDNPGDTNYKADSIVTSDTFKLSHNSSVDKKLVVEAQADPNNNPNDISLQAQIKGYTGIFNVTWKGHDKTRDDVWTNIPAGGYTANIMYRVNDQDPATISGTTAGENVPRTYTWEIYYTITDQTVSG